MLPSLLVFDTPHQRCPRRLPGRRGGWGSRPWGPSGKPCGKPPWKGSPTNSPASRYAWLHAAHPFQPPRQCACVCARGRARRVGACEWLARTYCTTRRRRTSRPIWPDSALTHILPPPPPPPPRCCRSLERKPLTRVSGFRSRLRQQRGGGGGGGGRMCVRALSGHIGREVRRRRVVQYVLASHSHAPTRRARPRAHTQAHCRGG